MTSLFRTTALAAALATASLGALASSVVIDFAALGQQALSAGVPANSGAPVLVGSVQGLVFSNAYAYHSGMLKDPPMDLKVPGGTSGGFLLNDDRMDNGPSGFPALTIARGTGLAQSGQFFDAFDATIFSSVAEGVTISFFSGGSRVRDLPPGSGTGAAFAWLSKSATMTDTEQIDQIVISAGSAAYFGLRSLTIGLTAGSTPVPEPASYALVGLALLAAGAASRRRA